MSEDCVCPPSYISEELIIEIIKRLPVKSLLRFMCVSKPLHSLVKSPNFISTHFNRHKKEPRYLMYCDSEKREAYCVHADGENLDMSLEFTCPYMYFIVGCCDGIVCFSDILLDTTCFLLWNSSLRRYLDLKVPHCTTSDDNDNFTHWFGFDSVSNDYKFVWVGYSTTDALETRLLVVYIYSLNERTWRCVNSSFVLDDAYVIISKGVYLNGVIHWGAKRYYEDHGMPELILAFDLAHATFGVLNLPSEVFFVESSYDHVSPINLADLMIVKIGHKSCLAILHQYWTTFNLWLMEEEGIVDSWRKEIDVRFNCYIDKILNFRMNGELMIHVESGGTVEIGSLGSLDLRRMPMWLFSIEKFDYVGTYIENLVLL